MSHYAIYFAALTALTFAATGCGDDGDANDSGGPLSYGRAVESYSPGPNAGYGQDAFPEVVLGAPDGHGTSRGSLDVLSLGAGGVITLEFASTVVDGEGDDFIVFENAFWAADDPTQVFAELGEVSVSVDGESWVTFPCDPTPELPPWDGCAGWTPTLEFDPDQPLDPATTGGDAFDLADVGLSEARFIRIRDLETRVDTGSTCGFDLDAIGIIHHE